jgi:CheY-like chemotaxis protein
MSLVLLVDDEVAAVRALRDLIDRAFAGTVTAMHMSDSVDALDFLLSPAGENVALCIVDLHMPNMTGRALIERAIAIRPELWGKFVLCSGDPRPSDPIFTTLGCKRLDKPFELEELVALVQGAIG